MPAEAPVLSPSLPPLPLFAGAVLEAVGEPLGSVSASSVAEDGRMLVERLAGPDADRLAGTGAVVGTEAALGNPGMAVSVWDGAGAEATVGCAGGVAAGG